jgi:hypothetical protein
MSDVLKLLLIAVAAVVLLELVSVASTGHLLDRPHPIWVGRFISDPAVS